MHSLPLFSFSIFSSFSSSSFFSLFPPLFWLPRAALSLYIYIYFFFPSSFPICISRLLALQSNITPFFSIIRKLSTCHGQANEGFRYRREPRNFLTLKKISWKYIAQKLLLYAQKDKRFGKKKKKKLLRSSPLNLNGERNGILWRDP